MSVHVRLTVAGEAYAVPVGSVLEVVPLGEVTDVPGSRAELLGVLNLRGQILAVADLAPILGLGRAAEADRTMAAEPAGRPAGLVMMVAESAGRQAGFVIDEVSAVGEVADPTEPTESPVLAGATLADGELIGVIDLDRVFDALAEPPASGRP
jgi:purine-binding chemotaxis protein CheW